MPVSAEFKAFVCDHFSEMGNITTRNMFGGAGVYGQGVMFGLLAQDTLYLKADPAMMEELAALGCGPFVFTSTKTGKSGTMGYWTIPDSAMDDPFEAVSWGRRALDFALSKQKK